MLKSELEEKVVELENLVETMQGTINDRDKEIANLRNSSKEEVSKLRDSSKEEVSKLRDERNLLQQQVNEMLEMKTSYGKIVDFNKTLIEAVKRYETSYTAFLKNIQGGLENAVEYKSLIDEMFKK